jgi:hypothetical protein
MTQFLPAWIFSVFVPAYGCCAICLGLRANPFSSKGGIPGVKEGQTGSEKVMRNTRWHHGRKSNFAQLHHARRMVRVREVPLLNWSIAFFSVHFDFSHFFSCSNTTPPKLLLSLIFCDPRLRLLIRLRPRVIQVSAFPPLPFFFLNGWNVLYRLLSFSSFCSIFVLFCFCFL